MAVFGSRMSATRDSQSRHRSVDIPHLPHEHWLIPQLLTLGSLHTSDKLSFGELGQTFDDIAAPYSGDFGDELCWDDFMVL